MGYVNSPEGIDDIQLGFLSTLSIPANPSASGGCASLSIEKSLGKQFSLEKKQIDEICLKLNSQGFFSRFAYQAISSSNIWRATLHTYDTYHGPIASLEPQVSSWVYIQKPRFGHQKDTWTNSLSMYFHTRHLSDRVMSMAPRGSAHDASCQL